MASASDALLLLLQCRPTPITRSKLLLPPICGALLSHTGTPSAGRCAACSLVQAAPPPNLEELELVKEWVVFSDLHLRSQNCEVCMDVLRYVHRQAQER